MNLRFKANNETSWTKSESEANCSSEMSLFRKSNIFNAIFIDKIFKWKNVWIVLQYLMFLESLVSLVHLVKAEALPVHVHEVGDVLHVQAGLLPGHVHHLLPQHQWCEPGPDLAWQRRGVFRLVWAHSGIMRNNWASACVKQGGRRRKKKKEKRVFKEWC